MLNKDWELELTNKTPNEAYNKFLMYYNKAVEECVPTSYTTTSNKYIKPLWMRGNTLKQIKKKHHLLIKYLNTKRKEDNKIYKETRNDVTHKLRRDRQEYEKKLSEEVKQNVNAFWKYANSMRKTRTTIPDLKRKDGSLTKTDKEKAETLNQQFTSVFTKEDVDNIPEMEDKQLIDSLDSIMVTEDMVKQKLKELRVDKSPGPDKVHPYILKNLADTISKPLTLIYNKSLQEETLPDIWKVGNITALFKKGNKMLPQNYRPISLTAIVCKVLESIITTYIIKHLEQNNLYDIHQHGFTHGKSTVTNLLQALNIWSEALSHGIPVDVIYLDFEKAFDKVPHQRLIKQLDRYGIRGQLLHWIQDFLTNRTQRVRINDELSNSTRVLSGVPQGSVLGPVLFLIYVSDISSIVQNFASLFADDTKLFSYILEVQDNLPSDTETNYMHSALSIQEDINMLTYWAEKMQMSFNLAKCHVLHLGYNNHK